MTTTALAPAPTTQPSGPPRPPTPPKASPAAAHDGWDARSVWLAGLLDTATALVFHLRPAGHARLRRLLVDPDVVDATLDAPPELGEARRDLVEALDHLAGLHATPTASASAVTATRGGR